MRISPEEQSNLRALLLHPDDNNTVLALELMPARSFPRELLTEVFVVYKLTRDESLRRKASAFLHHHPFPGLLHVMNSNLQLGKNTHLQPTEQTIKKNIDTYVNLSQGALDGLRFAWAIYQKYGLGLKYLLDRLPVEECTDLLRTFVTGTKFELVNSSLTTIPKELYAFKHLTVINLSDNKLKTVPSKIKRFKQLEELYLSNNNLVSVTPDLRKLAHLRVLDLSHNKFKQFPAVVTELTQLEALNIAQLNHLLLGETMPMPASIQRLDHLKRLCLSDNISGYSQGLLLNYNQYPNLSTVEAPAGEALDLDPLALAEYAYAQNGKSEGVLYLFAHSTDDALIQRIIREQFYDEATGAFDLKGTMLRRLPAALRSFAIRRLHLRGAYLGTEHYALGTKNAHRAWVLHDQQALDDVFAALEDQHDIQEADLSRNRLQYLPRAMRSWKHLRRLDLSQNVLKTLPSYWSRYPELEVLDLRNNHLTALSDDFGQLQNLRVLYLNNNQFEELPAVLGQLHNLEELHLVNALQPTDGGPAPVAIPTEWAGLRALKKLHFYSPSIQKMGSDDRSQFSQLLPADCVVHLSYA